MIYKVYDFFNRLLFQIQIQNKILFFSSIYRGSKTESLADQDLMIGVYRAAIVGANEPKLISYVERSNRKIKPSVLCSVFLDPGTYVIGKNSHYRGRQEFNLYY